jgi:hypothetical protein
LFGRELGGAGRAAELAHSDGGGVFSHVAGPFSPCVSAAGARVTPIELAQGDGGGIFSHVLSASKVPQSFWTR